MRLAEPGWLALLALVPWPILSERARPRLAWPTLAGFRAAPWTWARALRHGPTLCRSAAIACLVVALARPQSVGGRTRIAAQGVAIVVALDQSPSMSAPMGGGTTRLAAAQQTFARFVRGRPDDLVGLVAFARYPKLSCVPTLNHAVLLEAAARLKKAGPGDDGTNIGYAMAEGLDALVRAAPRKKVLILLTDGRENPAVPDPIDPAAMARLARDLGVVVHTIAVGRPGGMVRVFEPETNLPMPGGDEGPDFERLVELAELGGGRAFSAGDPAGLDEVFRAIDALETSTVRGTIVTRYREDYAPWVMAALGLIALARLGAVGRLRRLP